MTTLTAGPREVRLDSRGPVDLTGAANFLAGWPPATHSGLSADGALRLAFVTDDHTRSAAVTLRQASPDQLEALFTEPASPELIAQVRRVLGLDLDGPGFTRLARRDPALARLRARGPGARPVLFNNPYEAAAWAVLSARTPAARAAAHRRQLLDAHGTHHHLDDGHRLAAFPTPAQLRAVQALSGVPAEKVRRLHAVAEAAENGRLDVQQLSGQSAARALGTFKTIRGIGDFYAQLILIRALPGADMMPTAEPRLLAAATRLFGRADPLTPDELTRLTDGWSPHRSWAAFLLRTTT